MPSMKRFRDEFSTDSAEMVSESNACFNGTRESDGAVIYRSVKEV